MMFDRALLAAEGGKGEGGGGVPRKKPIQPPDFSAIPGGDGWEGTGWEDAALRKRGRSPRKPAQGAGPDFKRRGAERAEHPRRVRGGIKLESEAWPMEVGPFGQPIADLVDRLVEKPVRAEAFGDYARRGQVKTMSAGRGVVEAVVQGRRYRPYTVTVRLREHGGEVWDRLVASLDARPRLAAKLIAGEMPEEMLEFAASQGAPLSWREEEVSRETTSPEEGVFDKHAACVLMLLAERVAREPMVLLTLRGMPQEELVERLRQRRAVTASGQGSAAAYDPPRVEEADAASVPLDAAIDRFWDAGPELGRVEAPLRKPEVSHPILRRLGPSPFAEGRFPLVGLLATCYDAISDAALREPGEAGGASDAERASGDKAVADEGGAVAGEGASGEGDDEGGGPRRVTRSRVRGKAKARAKKKG